MLFSFVPLFILRDLTVKCLCMFVCSVFVVIEGLCLIENKMWFSTLNTPVSSCKHLVSILLWAFSLGNATQETTVYMYLALPIFLIFFYICLILHFINPFRENNQSTTGTSSGGNTILEPHIICWLWHRHVKLTLGSGSGCPVLFVGSRYTASMTATIIHCWTLRSSWIIFR